MSVGDANLEEEAVIVRAEIAAGHDGAAELPVRLRFPGGGESAISLPGEKGLALMKTCGAADLAGLTGQPWRRIIEGD
jgi:hypothetical protein